MLPGLILDAYSVRNPHTIPLFFFTFSQSRKFKFACCLGLCHLQIALNLLRYPFFNSYRMQALLIFYFKNFIKFQADIQLSLLQDIMKIEIASNTEPQNFEINKSADLDLLSGRFNI